MTKENVASALKRRIEIALELSGEREVERDNDIFIRFRSEQAVEKARVAANDLRAKLLEKT